MTAAVQNQPTLAETLWQGDKTLARNITLAVLGSLALWVSAKIHIPFYPVPLTMQTFVVLVIGMSFGWRLGGATVALYLAEGAMGLPVFSGTPEKGLGLVYLMGPTGGYLLGMLVAAVGVGWLAEHGWDRRIVTTALAMLIGNALIYMFGLAWLGSLIGWDKPVLSFGFFPFIPGDILKLVLAAIALPAVWKLLGKTPKSS
ncbi:MAG: biotin transporter BioY [Granulosicoccaceae bacterium]